MANFPALVCAFVLLMIGTASAQSVKDELIGINDGRLLIEELDDHSAKCGVTVDKLRAAVLSPVGSSKLKIAADGKPPAPILYLSVNTAHIEKSDLCTSSFILQFYARETVRLGSSGRSVRAQVTLWERSNVAYSPPGRHGQQATGIVERLTKAFLADWTLANSQ